MLEAADANVMSYLVTTVASHSATGGLNQYAFIVLASSSSPSSTTAACSRR